MKATIVLTLAIFLVSAPVPDSKTISEISAGFLLSDGNSELLADQTEPTSRPVSIRRSESLTLRDTERKSGTR